MTSITSSNFFSVDRAAPSRATVSSSGIAHSANSDVNVTPLMDVKTVAKTGFQKQAVVGSELERIDQKIDESVQHLNSMLKANSTALNMSMDRVLGAPVVTVRDLESGEVIRQIPNEVVVKLAHSLEAFKGWLHDGKA